MITSIELGDFLAHSNTKLEFENGVTVFVGDNGAGKSSIIDAITFALFGQHTRKSNKGLIKRGSNQGFAKISFSINDKQFEAVRKIDSKGALAATFAEVVNGERVEIAAGERKQFGESMTQEVEKVIGLDFEKLKIASIVQQGELNAIINAKPKEFKELLNAIIGIDKLDVASEVMKTVNKEFREKIRDSIGYDDTHIEILFRELERYQKEIKKSKPEKKNLEIKQEQLKKEVDNLRTKVETEAPKIDKINQLELRKKELSSYAKEAIQEIQREISENERKIHDCEGCFEHAVLKSDLESKILKVEEAIDETLKQIQEMTNQTISLKEKLSLASKLQLKDNKCPVCDSNVEKLNPLFQENHLRQEITDIESQIISKEKEKVMYNQKKKEFSTKLQIARDAEATLRAHSINSKEELMKIQEEVKAKKQRIPLTTNGSLLEISTIDSHAKMIYENISKLEEETVGFDQQEFNSLKILINEKQMSLSQIDQQIGGISEKISKGEEQINIIEKAITELKVVKEYVSNLNDIQTNIFSRDGPVATSLRSWALNTISAKASEYLTLLNTKIQRIMLSEKTRDISIACYSKTEVLELESLSGGEKVSVALALRLGMSSLLGASNLNLMILDEPTTHLDAERKKSLVGVLSQLSDISNSETRMQFLIITHDAEIFEDSTVEQIYRFESSEQGSKVTAL
ncbi:chromosome segregation protein SMC [Nitrosopumilus oxyclinae]|uniref:Chromosome segregation protein SMC n=1 Tax=Nitrosopumilus oxyclinae TaxID=1959104 RepID=A0A7D5M207_9ARCH|nr:SMC family ATPase [Nitrosopumilus oxyclinae]QLH05054.1 chromosome segregation protein SMC [Nitrosopumilus oxyclinae]